MKAIVAVDKNWGIGKDGRLLAHLPGDLKYFKENTMGKVLIMGRKTLESLPGGKALPSRITIAITANEEYKPLSDENLIIVHSFDELMQQLLKMEAFDGIDLEEDVFVAGGAGVYKDMMPYCDKFLVTKMEAEFDADKYFQNLDLFVEKGYMKITGESETYEENGIKYRFMVYERI